jgi:uroporphyrinogen decarboxylase
MTSRERVLASITHKEPDRPPVDLGASTSSGIAGIAYGRLRKHLGLKDAPTRVFDVVQQLAVVDDDLLDLFGVDVLDIGRLFDTEDSDWHDVVLSDGSTAQYPVKFNPVMQPDGSRQVIKDSGLVIGKMPAGGTFFDQTFFPYQQGFPSDYKNLGDDMSNVIWGVYPCSPWNHAADEGFWETLRQRVLELRKTTDRALMVRCGCNLVEWGMFLRRMDNFLMDIMVDQPGVQRLLDALMERHLDFLAKVCEYLGDIVDIARLGDDLGTDDGLLIPPDSYRKLFKPRHKQLCNFIHANSSMHTQIHSCGSIYELIPDLIEAGIEIINPVQTNCKNMEPEKIKREFGKDIVFWGGGCDTREILNLATADQVREHVRKRMDILSSGGGFVFATVHNILSDVPPENIVAAFETARDYIK